MNLSLKRLWVYGRLLRKKQLQDAIDWMEALCRPSAKPVRDLLYRARTRMVDHHGYDPARLYIARIWTERGPRVMSIHQQRAGYYFRKKKLQNMMQLVVREMPMNEYFHKVYIMKEVPRSVTLDMRMALRDGRAPRSYEREWAP
ncbi:hypothetical protein FOZ63_014958 [Perkinsus olseni]|nr:hypothetical protein FOZ63_014958 [Perkinsus olseni]